MVGGGRNSYSLGAKARAAPGYPQSIKGFFDLKLRLLFIVLINKQRALSRCSQVIFNWKEQPSRCRQESFHFQPLLWFAFAFLAWFALKSGSNNSFFRLGLCTLAVPGGSHWVVSWERTIQVSGARNHFPLADATAGGCGGTVGDLSIQQVRMQNSSKAFVAFPRSMFHSLEMLLTLPIRRSYYCLVAGIAHPSYHWLQHCD